LQSDKTIHFGRDNDFISSEYLWSYKYAGEQVTFQVVRDGKPLNLTWGMQRRLVLCRVLCRVLYIVLVILQCLSLCLTGIQPSLFVRQRATT
jgi:hypothetical protein